MSSDGLRHEGEIESPDKDSAYAELRKRGIRAIRVVERIEPVVRGGFGGLRRRDWLVIASTGVLVAVSIAVAVAFSARSGGGRVLEGDEFSSVTVQVAVPHPRHHIAIPGGRRPSDFFTRPHEAFLSRYALPGAPVDPVELTDDVQRDFYDSIAAAVIISSNDAPEVAELKRIVAGMKEDARKYLSIPDGVSKLAMWLEERQSMERSYRSQFVRRVEKGEMDLSTANEMFRAMGLEEIR